MSVDILHIQKESSRTIPGKNKTSPSLKLHRNDDKLPQCGKIDSSLTSRLYLLLWTISNRIERDMLKRHTYRECWGKMLINDVFIEPVAHTTHPTSQSLLHTGPSSQQCLMVLYLTCIP